MRQNHRYCESSLIEKEAAVISRTEETEKGFMRGDSTTSAGGNRVFKVCRSLKVKEIQLLPGTSLKLLKLLVQFTARKLVLYAGGFRQRLRLVMKVTCVFVVFLIFERRNILTSVSSEF